MILTPEEIAANNKNPRPLWDPKKDMLNELGDLQDMCLGYIENKDHYAKASQIFKKLKDWINK